MHLNQVSANLPQVLLRAAITTLAMLCSPGVQAQSVNGGQRACKLGYDNSIFAPKAWPTRELNSYAQGQLGIVHPQYDHFYLLIAYRTLAGKAILSADLDHLRPFDPCWDDGSRAYHGHDWAASSTMIEAIDEWTRARQRIQPGNPTPTMSAGSTSSALGYVGYYIPNCNPDAFRTAARTLQARLAAYRNDPFVLEWAHGQDQVFAHCTVKSSLYPANAASDAPAWFRADRAYQIAAAHFYAGQYAAATALFDAIALDSRSPWRSLGSYLAARSIMRQASLQDPPESTARLSEARIRLDKARSTVDDPSLLRDIDRLVQRVRLRTDPTPMQAELDRRLSAIALPDTAGQDIRDFDPGIPREMSAVESQLPFGAWLQVMRHGISAVLPAGTSPPSTELWLVALLQSAKLSDTGLDRLLASALAVPKASPAYFTARYHVVRLTQDGDLAARTAQQLLQLPDREFSRQDKIRLKAAALRHARSASEFIALAYQEPIEMSASADPVPRQGVTLPVIDQAAAPLLNSATPLNVLYAMLTNTQTPTRMRDELRSIVWVRSLVLKRWDILHEMNPGMRASLPQATSLLRQMDEATDPDERVAIGAIFLARHPGLVGSISAEIRYATPETISDLALPNMHRFHLEDGSRANWWCSLPEGAYWRGSAPYPVEPPAFIGRAARQSLEAEMKVLRATPNATDYLGEIILDWAATHPRDDRLPEALRMLVRSARGGCVSPGTVRIGRDAFRHLHRYFPDSKAAKQTRTHA